MARFHQRANERMQGLLVFVRQLDPGRYDLTVGMYDFETGIRLPVAGSVDGAISLVEIEVVAK